MKKFLCAIFCLLPAMTYAQDNTWERINQVNEEEKVNPDAKYLVGAVPVVDGKVEFSTVIKVPGKSRSEIYQTALKYMTNMAKEANQTEFSQVVIDTPDKGEMCAAFQEWLVFKSSTLALDRTRFFYHLVGECRDGEMTLKMIRIHYLYEEERDPQSYTAEEWITDENALRKDKQRLARVSGKFRRKTIDRKDYIFSKFEELLNK